MLLLLEIESKKTSNWDSTRKVGFGQQLLCNDPSLSYDVATVNYLSGQTNNDPYYNPYAYIVSGDSTGHSKLCFDVTRLQIWTNIARFSFSDLTPLFTRDTSIKYFPYSTLIIMLATICFCLTVLFDDSSPLASSFNESSSSFTSSENNKYLMRRINVMSTIFLIGFLAGSGQSFMLIADFNCNRFLVNANYQYICDDILTAGIDLLSVIFPNNVLVRSYKQLIFAAVVIFIVTNLLACVQFNLGNIQHTRRRDRILPSMNTEGEETLRRALQEFERQLYIRESERRGPNDNQVSGRQNNFADRIAAISKRNQMIRSWKTSTKSDNNKCDDCSICLAPLYDDTVDVAEAIDVIIVPCSHQFHRPCIIEWSINHTCCPNCRANLVEENE